MPAHLLAQDAHAQALQRVRVEPLLVIEDRLADAVRRRRIAVVATDHRRQHRRGVGHRARHRPRGVLAAGNRNDAVAAHQAHRRLQADKAGDRRRADDAAVGFGADADGGEVRRDRGARARTGAAGIAVERVGVLRLPAAAAPARGRTRRTEVGPLAEVGLAEDHRAGGAQALHEERIARRLVVGECERAARVDHRHGVDVVLQQHGDAVHRAAHGAGLAFGIERVGFGERLRVEFDHRVERRARLVDRRDAIQVGLRQRVAGELALRHALLQRVDVGFVEGEGGTADAAGAVGFAGVGVAVFWAASRGWQPVAVSKARASKARRMARSPGRRRAANAEHRAADRGATRGPERGQGSEDSLGVT